MHPEGGPATSERLEIFVEHFASDAPSPVGIASPNHQKASPQRGETGALRAAHPGRAAECGRKISSSARVDESLAGDVTLSGAQVCGMSLDEEERLCSDEVERLLHLVRSRMRMPRDDV